MGLEMSVNLGRFDVGMTEPFGDLVQAHASNGELARERVSEHMRGNPFQVAHPKNRIERALEFVTVSIITMRFLIREEDETLLFLVGGKKFGQPVV